MYEQLPTRRDAQDDRTERIGLSILEKRYRQSVEAAGSVGTAHEALHPDQFVNPPLHLARQSSAFAIGKICHEDGSSHRLSPISTCLQFNTELTGHRIRLDLSEMTSFCLFPGQVLGVDGANPHGRTVSVLQFTDPPLLPLPSTLPQDILAMRDLGVNAAAPVDLGMSTPEPPPSDSTRAGALLVMVACGPYITHCHDDVPGGDLPLDPLDSLM
jgi:hypothetical protein